MKKIIIIGGGIGGLATAALLGKKGYSVTLLEKNEMVGGRASIFSEKGFTFDMGPSWYLMPDVFEKYFSYFGKKPSDFFKLKRLNPQYRVFFGSGEFVDISSNLKENLALFEKMEKGAGKKVSEYLEQAEKMYVASVTHLLYNNFTSITDFLKKDIMREGRKLPIYKSLDSFVSGYVKDERIKQILEYTIVFLGGSPHNTPAFYSLMSHIDFHMGVFYPMGGMYEVIKGLITLCKDNEVIIKTKESVEQIIVENGKAIGVISNKKLLRADIVLANADYHHVETQLLTKEWQTYSESYWKKKTLAPSTFLMYLGIKGRVQNLSHHNLFFANDWRAHFDEIFKNPSWPKKPSYYVCAPSKSDSSVAPKDSENIFFLTPIASGLKDTDVQREKYAKQVLSDLEKQIDERFQDRIVVKRIFTQRDFQGRYNAYKGTALGLAHTLFQTAFFRPQNKSKKVSNLYFVGQYTQPGIGMPICLISAELVANRIHHEQ